MFKLLKKGKLDSINAANTKLFKLFISLIFTFITTYSTLVYAGPNDAVTPDSGTTVDENEDNDTTPFDITSYFDLENDKLDVLVTGEIADEDDFDKVQILRLGRVQYRLQT